MNEAGSTTLTLVISVSVGVGLITAFLLYRAAFAKKEVTLAAPEAPKAAAAPASSSNVHEKVRKIFQNRPEAAAAASQISKLIEEEAQEMTRELRQEFSVKYQLAVQEKNTEVEKMRREYNSAVEKASTVEKLYKKVESEHKQTEAVVKSIAEGLVVVNQRGEVMLMNPSAEKLLGVDTKQKVGKPIYDGLPNEVLVSMAHPSKEGQDKVIEIQSKDENVKKILRSSSAVIQNEDGQTVGMVNILTDVTKQKELEEMKNKFVSNVTHELRTPIVAMQKAIEILHHPNAGELNDTQKNFLKIVSNNLSHLSRLVEDVLDIAKIDSGKMKIRLEMMRLDKVVNDACDVLDSWAKSKNIQIERRLDKGIPEMPLDPGKVTQVLNNLIGNAIKFTSVDGKITVETGWAKDGKMAQVSVKDTGIGINKENLPKLFKRFEQFGDQVGISGTGLGLSISKEIVEKHGGQIGVESEEKKGAKFFFTLPVHPKTA